MNAMVRSNFNNLISYLFKTPSWSVARGRSLHNDVLSSGYGKELSWTLSYWEPHYFNIIQSCFLSKCESLSTLQEFPYVFCRDGSLGLQAFFKRVPRPSRRKPILIICANLAPLVPPAWHNNVLLYEIGKHNTLNSPKNFPAPPRRRLILKGALLNSNQPHDANPKALLKALSHIKFSSFDDVSVFLWTRDDHFTMSGWTQDTYFTKRLNSYLPSLLGKLSQVKKLKYVTYEEFITSISQTEVSNVFMDLFDKGPYVSDDYVDYLLLSSNAEPLNLGAKKIIPYWTYVPLSPYHGYRILPPHEHGRLSVKRRGNYNISSFVLTEAKEPHKA